MVANRWGKKNARRPAQPRPFRLPPGQTLEQKRAGVQAWLDAGGKREGVAEQLREIEEAEAVAPQLPLFHGRL